MLVGNHDQWKKNAQLGHSMLLLNQTISKVQVFDTPDTLLLKGGDLQAYLLPAGFEGDPGFKPPAPSARGKEMHLALYHGMLRGSKYQNGMVSEHGRLADTLNNRAYDLVLCGDNHAHQKLDMLDQTQGWYVGAPCQHNWGDTGAERGFMYFEFDSSTRAVHAEFVPTKHPKFLRLEVQVASNKELLNWALAHKAEFKDNMVRVSVLGKSDDLSTLDTSSAEAAVRRFGARTCEFKPKFDNSAVTISSEEKKTVTDESIWAEYLQTKVDTLEGIDAVLLAELARGYFQ
jgi:DNA repair exonuclease SbcCD nuclease subunit